MNLEQLPAINASLNAMSTVLLLMGWVFIQQGRRIAHRNCMVSAFVVSCVFLVLYLVHKYVVVKGVHTPFLGPVWMKPLYLLMLFSHIALAMAVPVLALVTMSRAMKERFSAHKAIARWTWPIWMYVSVTGVLIYLVLYQLFPVP